MKRLIKRDNHASRKQALRAKLLIQVLSVIVDDKDAQSATQLQTEGELIKLTNWIKG
jgi:hypothetical protein